MSEPDYLEIGFPDQIGLIRQLRRADPVLGEICRDYEEIAAMLFNSEHERLGLSRPSQDHLNETLVGLQAEIAAFIRRRGRVQAKQL